MASGVIGTKFGCPLAGGEQAVAQALQAPNLNLVGLHFHIGSLIPGAEPYVEAIEVVLNFAAEMRRKYGFELRELNVGGGFAVQYVLDSPVPPIAIYAEAIASEIISKCPEL